MKLVFGILLLVVAAYGYPGGLFSMYDDDSSEEEFFRSLFRRAEYRPRVLIVAPNPAPTDYEDEGPGTSMSINPFSGINFPSFFSRPSLKSFFENVPESDGKEEPVKSSSKTEIVDGHKVVQNDTTYAKDGAVFRFHVIHISPVDSDEKEVEDGVEAKSGEDGIETRSGENDESTEAPEATTEDIQDASQDNSILREEVSKGDDNNDPNDLIA